MAAMVEEKSAMDMEKGGDLGKTAGEGNNNNDDGG